MSRFAHRVYRKYDPRTEVIKRQREEWVRGAIQANMEVRDTKRFDRDLEMNKMHAMTRFGFKETKKWMQTLPHDLTLLFGRMANIQRYPDTVFPNHHISFAEHNELYSRADKREAILTDYIAVIQRVGDERDVTKPAKKKVVWKDIIIQNLEGNNVRLSLRNDKAKDFPLQHYENLDQPVMMAVSSRLVKTYGGLRL